MEWSEAPLIGGFFDSPTENKAQRDLYKQAERYEQQRQAAEQAGQQAQQQALSQADPYNQFLQGYQQQQQAPGVAEQFFASNQGRYGQGGYAAAQMPAVQAAAQAPGVAEQFFAGLGQGPNAMASAWQQGQGLQAPSRAESQAGRYQAQLGGASQSEMLSRMLGGLQDRVTLSDQVAQQAMAAGGSGAGLDPYYEQASKRAGQDINRALAAQGLLGSAFGANKMVDAQTQLSAEQANREADFGLQQRAQAAQAAQAADANRLGFVGMAADLARGADASQLARAQTGFGLAQGADAAQLARLGLLGNLGAQYDQGWLSNATGLGNLALGAQQAQLGRLGFGMDAAMGLDNMDLSRAQAGQQAAAQAQALAQGRGQSVLDNQFRQQAQTQQNMALWNEMLANRDQALMDAQLASITAANQVGLNSSDRRRQQNQGLLDTALGVAGSFLGLG